MFCSRCGAKIEPGSRFCSMCGAPNDTLPQAAPAPAQVQSEPSPAPVQVQSESAPAPDIKNKGKVAFWIRLFINILNLLIGLPAMLISMIVSFLSPFGMMIGAYYSDTYDAMFITLALSAFGVSEAITALVFNIITSKRKTAAQKKNFGIASWVLTLVSSGFIITMVLLYLFMM